MEEKKKKVTEEHAAISRLERNGIRVDRGSKQITLKANVGLRLWSLIDCLVNHFKYRVRYPL